MDFTQFDTAINKLPRCRVGFYPTPFHALSNLSAAYRINLFMKREDLAGPSAISGSKMRLAEFILGRALENGVTHVITQGEYLTNSGLQFAAACLSVGITPILVLTRNVPRHGELGEFRGNYLLNKTMGVETHVINVSGNDWPMITATVQSPTLVHLLIFAIGRPVKYAARSTPSREAGCPGTCVVQASDLCSPTCRGDRAWLRGRYRIRFGSVGFSLMVKRDRG